MELAQDQQSFRALHHHCMVFMQRIGRLAELTEDWNFIAQYDGRGTAIHAILRKLIGFLYQRRQFIVMARSLLEPLPDINPNIDLEIRPFVHADLGLIQGIQLPSDVKLCALRLECGHLGVLALAENKLAGYAWCYTATQPVLDRVRFDLSPGDVLFLSDYTIPAFRGQGVHTALTLTRLSMFLALGYRRAFACVNSHNLPSLAVYRKVGSYEYGVIEDSRLGPWRHIHYRIFDDGN